MKKLKLNPKIINLFSNLSKKIDSNIKKFKKF